MSEKNNPIKTSNQLENKLGVQRSVPVNLRQSGENDAEILFSERVRKSPYWHLSNEAGAWSYSVYNHMFHPRAYIPMKAGGILKEYEYLTRHVTMWDVGVERQIQVKGPDAAKLVDLVITRSVEKVETGKARYVILCNEEGGIINDPVLLRPYEDEFWFSLSDSDASLWLQALRLMKNFDCTVKEIDVAPVQIQGPKATPLMKDVFGEKIEDIPYYGLMESEVNGCPVIVSKTGFSGEDGYEIFLFDASLNAEYLWYYMLDKGKPYNLKVIAPGHIRRIEGGILSYGQDMDQDTNPYEVGLDWQVDLTKDEFIGKEALSRIKEEGVSRKLVGMKFGGDVIEWYPADDYIVYTNDGSEAIGYLTSAFWSPDQESNIGFAMLPSSYAEVGTELKVYVTHPYANDLVPAEVAQTPFKVAENPSTGYRTTGRKLST